jgi:hypothetical protein
MTISELVFRSQRYLRAAFLVLVATLLVGGLSALLHGGGAYLAAYVVIVVALLPPIALWIYTVRRQIPLVPSLALVNLVWNALPLAFGNPQLEHYTDDEILRASGEVLVFGVALSTVYLIFSTAPSTRPREYLGFAISKFQSRRLVLGAAQTALAYCLIVEYLIMSGILAQWLVRMPVGTFSAIRVLQEAIKLATGFVLGYAIGAEYIKGATRVMIVAGWVMLFTMALASLLLSSAAGLTIAIAAGLYLGSGRIPWKYIFAVLIVVSFFNHSKHEMRKKYWGRAVGALQLHQFPEYFSEWSYLTVEKVFGDKVTTRRDKTQGLIERVSTLQMLLYVQRMVQVHQVPTVNGATYSMIPQLLVPRILWPEKPRTHEGQVLLNTHFGRQTRDETWKTYIAWGLIAEAYGNFGSMLGPLILGFMLGGLLTSIEVWSGNYPLMSIRGALASAVLLETLISYEMSAAVYVTSTGQLLVIILGSSMLLAGRHRLDRAA